MVKILTLQIFWKLFKNCFKGCIQHSLLCIPPDIPYLYNSYNFSLLQSSPVNTGQITSATLAQSGSARLVRGQPDIKILDKVTDFEKHDT